MTTGRIGYDRAGSIARITIDRPAKKNAFVGTMREELAFALDRAQNDPDARVVMISGVGGAFSAGGDLDFLAALSEARDTDGLRKLLDAGARIVRAIRKLEKPVVAAVDGVAAGCGVSLAAACDRVIASDRASFSLSFVRIGFIPDWGGTFFLPRRVGPARAFGLSSSGAPIDAATAREWGLVDRVVPSASFDADAMAEASALAERSPTSLSFQKYLIGSEEIPALDDALARETEAQLACFETEEFRAAMTARQTKT